MTQLILIRHGETDWNRELRFQGQVDVPLNAVGLEQARRVAEHLAGETAHHLVCSDLLRTRQTAEAPGLRLSLPVVHDSDLREQSFGVVDGMRSDDIRAQHPEAWERWLTYDADFAFDGGENTRHFHARAIGALQRLATAHAGRTLVVVTHGGVLDMVYRTARGLSLSGARQSLVPNGAINRVRVVDGRFEIVDWAETRHLAGMPPQPVYVQTDTQTSPHDAAVQRSSAAASPSPA